MDLTRCAFRFINKIKVTIMKPKSAPKKTKPTALLISQAMQYLIPAVKSRQRIYNMIAQGKFPNVFLDDNGLKRIPISDLDAENKRRKENPWLS
jgi:hypothetical protein